MVLVLLSLMCAEMGMTYEGYMFLVSAAAGLSIITRPSRRCAFPCMSAVMRVGRALRCGRVDCCCPRLDTLSTHCARVLAAGS